MTCPQLTFSKKTKNDHNLVSSHQKKITHFIQDSFPIRWVWGVVRGWFSTGHFPLRKKQAGAELCRTQLKLSLIGARLSDPNLDKGQYLDQNQY